MFQLGYERHVYNLEPPYKKSIQTPRTVLKRYCVPISIKFTHWYSCNENTIQWDTPDRMKSDKHFKPSAYCIINGIYGMVLYKTACIEQLWAFASADAWLLLFLLFALKCINCYFAAACCMYEPKYTNKMDMNIIIIRPCASNEYMFLQIPILLSMVCSIKLWI